MKDSLAVLAVRIAADMPDLSPSMCAIIQLMTKLSESDKNMHYMRFRSTLKGLDSRKISASDAFAALKVQVDDLVDRV